MIITQSQRSQFKLFGKRFLSFSFFFISNGPWRQWYANITRPFLKTAKLANTPKQMSSLGIVHIVLYFVLFVSVTMLQSLSFCRCNRYNVRLHTPKWNSDRSNFKSSVEKWTEDSVSVSLNIRYQYFHSLMS